MDASPEISEERIREMDKKDFRKEFPSGWMELARYETLVLIVDALLEAPATREFTTRELANKAGPSKKSVDERLSSLVSLGVLEKLEEGREEPRYSLNDESPITQKLYELNDTVNRVREGELPATSDSQPSGTDGNAYDHGSGTRRIETPVHDSGTDDD